MATIDKQPLTSMNITEEQLQNFKQLFPEAFTEGLKIDWDKLRLTLGETIDVGKERYGMNWPGKADCFKTIQQPSIATLVPARNESIDFDTTENLFIEGDNLEVLKLLQKSYLGKVKMIYIDPPYNTGNDFIYPDDFAQSMQNYMAFTGQVDAEGRSFSTNKDTNGRFHSDWLNMMYPRLFLAKNLLSEDGVIFISIDDKEVHNLKALCNEILGEENFRNYLIVRRRVKSLNLQFADKGLNTLNVGFEYILVYSKSMEFAYRALRMKKVNIPTKGSWNVFWSNADRPTMRYDILGFTPSTGQWRWSAEKANTAIKNYVDYLQKYAKEFSLEDYWELTGRELKFIRKIDNGEGKNGGVQYWIGPNETSLRTSNWTDIEVSQIHKDFDLPFENPKSTELLKTVIDTIKDKDFTVLDFFAGSATTAHAVMELNKEDGGNRKFICVQIPEPTDEKSEAYKAGYKNIAEISKERIRRVAAKIKKVQDEKELKESGSLFYNQNNQDNQINQGSDLGFKVFKLDKSNFKIWDATLEKEPEAIQTRLFEHIDHISPEAAQESILYELLLKSGFELTTPIESLTLPNGEGREGLVFSIAGGQLLICLEKELSHDCIKAMAEMQPTRVICLDEAFTGTNADALKTNAVQIMKSKGVVNFRTV